MGSGVVIKNLFLADDSVEGTETFEERAQRQREVLEMILWPRAYATMSSADVEIGGDPAKVNQHGETPLHIAARIGRFVDSSRPPMVRLRTG